MDAQSTLMIMKQTAPTATMGDAMAFLAICQERGLSPFQEASPILADYNKRNGEHVHSLAIKEHYAVQERWAQQCGGYIVNRSEVTPYEGGLLARVWIIASRDYAAVGKMASMIPSLNFREELDRFEVCGEAIVTEREFNRQAPATKTWEWVAEKRAREAALRQKFGKEPSQSRQIYTAALTQAVREDAVAALYGPQAPQQALAAPAEPQVIEGEFTESPQEPPAPTPDPEPTADAHWIARDDVRKRFWSWVRGELELSEAQAHEALQVEHIRDYPGTMDQAKVALEEYAAKRDAYLAADEDDVPQEYEGDDPTRPF